MQKNLLATNRKIVEGTFTGKAIGTKVCPVIWRFLVLIPIDMDGYLTIGRGGSYIFLIKPIQHPSGKIKFASNKYRSLSVIFFKKNGR